MAESDFFEQIKLFLPKYLTPQQKSELFAELSKFPENMVFYLSNAVWNDQILQGDGWRGFAAIKFVHAEKKAVSRVVISNSCDIPTGNTRDLPVNILFSPLIEVSKFAETLQAGGKSAMQIEDVLRNIKKQRVTSIFYLPERYGIWPESIILLDNIHAHPLQDFLQARRESLFTLNQYAFYLFLMKLSIHFSRFQE